MRHQLKTSDLTSLSKKFQAPLTNMKQACQRQNMPSATSQKWASAADETLSSRTNGTSKPQTRAMSGQDTASQLSCPQLQAGPRVRRRHFRPRQTRVKRAEMKEAKRNGASSRGTHPYYSMSERGDDVCTFCMLGICIFIVKRCIVPQIAWHHTTVSWAWNCTGTSKYLHPGIGSLAFGSGGEKGKGRSILIR